jgi:hypothetical protein
LTTSRSIPIGPVSSEHDFTFGLIVISVLVVMDCPGLQLIAVQLAGGCGGKEPT